MAKPLQATTTSCLITKQLLVLARLAIAARYFSMKLLCYQLVVVEELGSLSMAAPLLLTTTSSSVIKPWVEVARFVLAAWLDRAIVLLASLASRSKGDRIELAMRNHALA
jgi:hypothetical protein